MEKLLAQFTQKEGENFCLKYIDTNINMKKNVKNETIEKNHCIIPVVSGKRKSLD